jgi:photosystem II stability/assembly factor-like uncharacterized protein
MKLRRSLATCTVTAALAAGTAGAVAVPTAAHAVTGAPAAGTTSMAAPSPSSGLALATSWPTPRRGVVLGYPSRTTGAKSYLLATGNGGNSWTKLTAPPIAYPADNDQPDVTWSGGTIAVTNGNRIAVSTDNGKHWTAEKLSALPGSIFITELAVVHGRVFGLVYTSARVSVYASATSPGTMQPVPGLSASGDEADGAVTAAGGVLQVDLGQEHISQRYWYSRNGRAFTSAPLPCAATQVAYLGGVRAGKVIALCTDGASSASFGQTLARPRVAGTVGGTFHPVGTAAELPNVQSFAAASPQAMTAGTEGGLVSTGDAAAQWASALTEANGAQCTDLAFPGTTTGYVACSTVNSAGKQTGTVYRTTSSGRSWTALS